jgi:glycosyltransferase involved in cell wall biosynthesis
VTRSQRIYFYVGKAAHPLYREQFRIVPDNFTYVPSNPDLAEEGDFHETLARRFGLRGRIERRVKTAAVVALAIGGHVRSVSIAAPQNTVLIHSAQVLLKNPPRPYIVDFENLYVFSLYQRIALERPWARQRLTELLHDPACRYLLPWTDTARRGLLTMIDTQSRDQLAARAITVRPAIRATVKNPMRRRAGPLRVAFVGARFFEKGGVEAVRAVRRVRDSYDVELDLVSSVPKPWRHRLRQDDAIRIHQALPPASLRRLYERSHALLFPTHVDTFGYVVLEAFASATPVLAPNHHALPEMISDGVSGLLFQPENSFFSPNGRPRFALTAPPAAPLSFVRALEKPSDAYVDRIANQLARLAEDPDLVERLTAGALEQITHGPFSVERRREQLRRIYQLALDSGDGGAT